MPLGLDLLLAAAAIGAAACLTAWRATQRERRAERDFPPSGRMIGPPGQQVHAETLGTGPDVILIHGASGNTRDFTHSLMKRLAPDFRVTAYDRPGLGWSDKLQGDSSPAAQARVLRDSAAELRIERPIIVGHSYGGAVAMAWALDDPGNVGAMVLLGAATMPWTSGLGVWYGLTSSPIGRAIILPLVTAFAPRRAVDDAMRVVFEPDPVPADYSAHFAAPLTMRRKVLAENARQVSDLLSHVTAMSPRYGEVTLPVEIVHGTADTIVYPDIHSVALARILPDAVLTLLPGIGHMPHHASPDAVVDAIRRAAERAGLRPPR